MESVLLIGTYPPPFGGVTIHIKRFINLFDAKEFEIGVLDLNKKKLFRGEDILSTSNAIRIIIFFFKADIIHLHIQNNLKIAIILISKLFRKNVIYTQHNSRIGNVLIWKVLNLFCDRIILVNSNNIEHRLINKDKIKVIPAFLPPDKLDLLPDYVTIKISNYKYIFSSNCFRLSQFQGRDLYGFDLIIQAFHYLSKKQIVDNSLLLLVDPSNTTRNYVQDLIHKKDFFSNDILHITENINFASLIKKSTLTIRATRTDGDSISVRESLYYNIPVIASDITTRPNGTILFKTNDSIDLARKIKNVINNRNIFKKNKCQRNFGLEICNIYKSFFLKKDNKL